MKIYRVKNWEALYENNRTRELKHMSWVPVPNSHDGDGYTALVCRESGPQLYGAWIVILQVASKCGNHALSCGGRGTLVRDNGFPHDAASLSRITRFPENIIKLALDALVSRDVGWLICEEMPTKAAIPHEGAAIPHPTDYGTERNGTERIEKKEGVASLPPPAIPEKEKPKEYHEHARVALHWLNEKSGKHFRETDANLARISARLNEQGVDIEGVKQMIDRQCALWGPDAKMSEYLRPETLFGKEKFDNYYAARLVEVKSQAPPQFVDSRNIKPPPGAPEFCPGWKNKDWRHMTKKELDVYVDQ